MFYHFTIRQLIHFPKRIPRCQCWMIEHHLMGRSLKKHEATSSWYSGEPALWFNWPIVSLIWRTELGFCIAHWPRAYQCPCIYDNRFISLSMILNKLMHILYTRINRDYVYGIYLQTTYGNRKYSTKTLRVNTIVRICVINKLLAHFAMKYGTMYLLTIFSHEKSCLFCLSV